MKRNLFVLAVCAMVLVGCGHVEKDIIVCGTYTGSGSYGVYSLAFDNQTGDIELIDSVSAENPSYLALSEDKKFVYAVRESGGNSGVYSISFDSETGKFGEVSLCDEVGADPCYITRLGDSFATADYSGGSVSFFAADDSGRLERIAFTQFYGRGQDSIRQKSSHIHCVMPSPDGKVWVVSDLGKDKLYIYKDKESVLPDSLSLEPGFGPRHIAFTPDSRYCYVLGELSGNIVAMNFDGDALVPFQTVMCDSLNARASADVHVSADGKFIYASNRRQGDGIRIYSIGTDGRLANVGYEPTGKHPRNFVITPSGKFVLVAARDDNRVEVYARNEETGELTNMHKDFHLPKPVCLKFVGLKP